LFALTRSEIEVSMDGKISAVNFQPKQI